MAPVKFQAILDNSNSIANITYISKKGYHQLPLIQSICYATLAHITWVGAGKFWKTLPSNEDIRLTLLFLRGNDSHNSPSSFR